MGKVVLLTGAPGVGKSTLRCELAEQIPGIRAFDYGRLLLERKESEGVSVQYHELREKSASIISPKDVGDVDECVIGRINELRKDCDVVLDSHALTAEHYGLRAVPFSSQQVQRLKLDAVLVLRCDPEVLIERARQNPEGRRDISIDLMRELQILQEAVGISYAIHCDCPIFFIDTTGRRQDEVAKAALAVLASLGFGRDSKEQTAI